MKKKRAFYRGQNTRGALIQLTTIILYVNVKEHLSSCYFF